MASYDCGCYWIANQPQSFLIILFVPNARRIEEHEWNGIQNIYLQLFLSLETSILEMNEYFIRGSWPVAGFFFLRKVKRSKSAWKLKKHYMNNWSTFITHTTNAYENMGKSSFFHILQKSFISGSGKCFKTRWTSLSLAKFVFSFDTKSFCLFQTWIHVGLTWIHWFYLIQRFHLNTRKSCTVRRKTPPYLLSMM